MNLNASIKSSKKNYNSVLAAVQAVHASHANVVAGMGGVLALANVVLAAVMTPGATIATAASLIENALKKTIGGSIAFLANLAGCRNVIQKILHLLT